MPPEQKAGFRLNAYPEIIRKTIKSIIEGYDPLQIWLHGSYARGDFHQESDLDLIIIKVTDKKFPDRIEEVLQYCPFGIAVEPMVYTPEEKKVLLAENNIFLKTALSEGVLIYEQ